MVTPQDVLRIGAGDLKRGHRILDRFVEDERARQIKKLKALPGPVKSTHRGGRDTGGGIAGLPALPSNIPTGVPDISIQVVPAVSSQQRGKGPPTPGMPQQQQDQGINPLQAIQAYQGLKGLLTPQQGAPT